MDYKKQVEASLFARILAMNHEHFDFYQCNFKLKNMYHKDRSGNSKEGCGRVTMFKES